MEKMVVNSSFWNGKRVFLTGHTGFKGGWLTLWLESMGAKVTGYSLPPTTNPNLYRELTDNLNSNSIFGDILNFNFLSNSICEADPEIVFHMAAQPLVRYSYENPIETYQTNVMGTVHLLQACRNLKNLKSVIIVTTDKVYENYEWFWAYRENDRLGGHDPYSSSKASAEIVTSAMKRSYFYLPESASIVTARAGNVIGGGDWSTDRLIPDVVRSFQKSEVVNLRNPKSVRPWQHVLEPLSGYLILAEYLNQKVHDYSDSWNFGPDPQSVISVEMLVALLASRWPGVEWKVDHNKNHPHEATLLTLDCSKANQQLRWSSKWNIEKTCQMTMDWYRSFYKKEASAYELCQSQINDYMGK